MLEAEEGAACASRRAFLDEEEEEANGFTCGQVRMLSMHYRLSIGRCVLLGVNRHYA